MNKVARNDLYWYIRQSNRLPDEYDSDGNGYYVRQSSITQALQDAGYNKLEIYYINEILRRHCNSYINAL